MKEVDKAEAEEFLKVFMPLYEQADTLIHKIVEKDADGLPASLETLIEAANKLLPILLSLQELPKPKYKELRRLKKEFNDVLKACIQAGEWAFKFAQNPGRVRLANIVFSTTLASGIMENCSKRLTSLSNK